MDLQTFQALLDIHRAISALRRSADRLMEQHHIRDVGWRGAKIVPLRRVPHPIQ